MDLIHALETRRSVRKYLDKPVEPEWIEKIIGLATLAPSAMNSQPWLFVVIQDRQKLAEISDQAKTLLLEHLHEHPPLEKYRGALSKKNFNIFYNAPALIAIYARPEGPEPETDACLAAQNLMLAAHNEGLATCWIGFARAFLDSDECKTEMGLPLEYKAAAPVIIGYPAIETAAVPRKSPEIHWK